MSFASGTAVRAAPVVMPAAAMPLSVALPVISSASTATMLNAPPVPAPPTATVAISTPSVRRWISWMDRPVSGSWPGPRTRPATLADSPPERRAASCVRSAGSVTKPD